MKEIYACKNCGVPAEIKGSKKKGFTAKCNCCTEVYPMAESLTEAIATWNSGQVTKEKQAC